MLRVQGHILRWGDEVDLDRPPRRGHLRAGLVPLEEGVHEGSPFRSQPTIEDVVLSESPQAPVDPEPVVEAEVATPGLDDLHWRRVTALAKVLGKDCGTDHRRARAFLDTLSPALVAEKRAEQGW